MLAGENAFASGGLLLMIIGGVSVWLRAVPERIWYWIVRQATMMITVNDDDAAFVWVKEWFLEQEFLKRIRHVDLDSTMRNERIAMIPVPGMHWFWYEGRPFRGGLRTEESHERATRRMESLTFRTLGRKRAFLQCFVNDVVSCHTRRMGVQSYLYIYNDGWDYVKVMSRGCSTRWCAVVSTEKEHLVEDVKSCASKQRYARLGIPYHRGYLLVWASGDGQDFAGFGAGGSLWAFDLRDESYRLQRPA